MGLFDLSSLTITAPLATRRDPLPEGEPICQIIKVEPVSGEKNGKGWFKLNVVLDIADADYLAAAGRDKASITYGIMLDMTEAGTVALGPNRNVNLGKFMEAAGCNKPGKSPQDAMGAYVKARISHRPDPNDPAVIYDDVKGVTKAG